MDFLKNTDLIQNICEVKIKSVDTLVDLPDLTDVYFTPSKITLSKRSDFRESGTLHVKSLRLDYPGLSSLDFEKFNDLLRGQFLVTIKLTTNDIWDLCSTTYPMKVSTSYSNGHQLVFEGTDPFPIKFRGNQSDPGIDDTGFNYDFNFFLE